MLYAGRYWLLVYSLLFVVVWLLDLCLVVLIDGVLVVRFLRLVLFGICMVAAGALRVPYGLVGLGWCVLVCG